MSWQQRRGFLLLWFFLFGRWRHRLGGFRFRWLCFGWLRFRSRRFGWLVFSGFGFRWLGFCWLGLRRFFLSGFSRLCFGWLGGFWSRRWIRRWLLRAQQICEPNRY